MVSHLSSVNIFFRGGFLLQLFFMLASSCLGEELEPRRWSHLPIYTNFGGAAYGYSDGDIDFDPVLKIVNGQFQLHTWAAKYIRKRLLNPTYQNII